MDISIKPVGAPTVSPLVSSATDGARGSVPTQLPAPLTVTPVAAPARTQTEPQTTQQSVSHQVTIDRDAAAIVYQTIDDRTSEVIGQFPAEGVLKSRAYARAQEESREAALPGNLDRHI